ncbi:hypothetical protein CDAR_420541, partial [Caerostris darwini]
FCVG